MSPSLTTTSNGLRIARASNTLPDPACETTRSAASISSASDGAKSNTRVSIGSGASSSDAPPDDPPPLDAPAPAPAFVPPPLALFRLALFRLRAGARCDSVYVPRPRWMTKLPYPFRTNASEHAWVSSAATRESNEVVPTVTKTLLDAFFFPGIDPRRRRTPRAIFRRR